MCSPLMIYYIYKRSFVEEIENELMGNFERSCKPYAWA